MLLDREDVGEIRCQLDRELDRDRIAREIRDDDVLLQVVGHEALAADQQLVGREAAGGRIAQEERRREVLDLAGRERHRALAVDREPQAREKAGVVRVEPLRALLDRTVIGTDAERRPVEDCERHHIPACPNARGLTRTGGSDPRCTVFIPPWDG